MYLIVGLGNPEKEYGNSRHNMGFNVINKIADICDIEIEKSKFKGLYGAGIIKDEKVILLKPQTYMNLSGDSLVQFRRFYKIENDKIIVIYDDVDLDVGDIRIRKQGSSGTHNGMRSVIRKLGTEDFIRVRIGIGMPEHKGDIINYVIGNIPKDEQEILEKSIKSGAEAIIEILENGVESAMNKFN